jgi:hypothetical protein
LDGTRDFELRPKDLSQGALKKLVPLLGAMCMSMQLQLKIVSAVGIFRLIVSVQCKAVVDAKEATGQYHRAVMEIPKESRGSQLPPFILVVIALFTFASEVAVAQLPDHSRLRHDITAYMAELTMAEESGATAKADRLLADFRYARFRRTHKPEFVMLEFGMSALVTDTAKAAWSAVKAIMISIAGAVEKHGIAPKSDMERRVEAILRRIS